VSWLRRAGRALPRALKLALIVCFLCFLVPIAPAHGAWLDEHHAELCRQHGGAYFPLLVLRTAPKGTACGDSCFRYNLGCRDGTQLTLFASYNPDAGADDVFFAEGVAGSVVKLLLIAGLGFVAFVSVFGTTEDRSAIIWQNILVFVILAGTISVWGIRATNDGFTLGALIDFPAVVKYPAIFIFIAVRFPSVARGWNYLFVRHPAAPIVSSGGPMDMPGLVRTLVSGAEDPGIAAPYHYEHQSEKARALASRLDEDTAIIKARAERARLRAELVEAERLLEEARRRSENAR
jgi:hypothetical protein